ncbi:hypothetical protein OROMI_027348 [Orobanche minor]
MQIKRPSRVLRSSSSSSLSSPSQSLSSSSSLLNPKPTPPKVNSISEQQLQNRNPIKPVNSDKREQSDKGFDPFDPLIISGKKNPNEYSLEVFECPLCAIEIFVVVRSFQI